MKTQIIFPTLALMLALAMGTGVQAQDRLPQTRANVVYAPVTQREVSGNGQIVKLSVVANADYTISQTPGWIKAARTDGGITLNIQPNRLAAPREGVVTLVYNYRTSLTATSRATIDITIKQRENALDGVNTGMSLADKDFDVFQDRVLLTSLKPGVTAKDVEQITNPLARTLATQLLDGSYDKTFRVHKFKCILSPSALGKKLHIGDGYTKYQNPTGIVVNPGRTVVLASGIPEGKTVQLLVKRWVVPDGQRSQPQETFTLRNGVNVINRTSDWRGLSYVSYFDDTNPSRYDSVGIHIVNGQVNGYFDWSCSNADWDRLLANATYGCFDMVGHRAQAVFPVADLQKYASGKGRWLMAAYDSIVYWEQRLIGLEKYNLMPENRILARVNYSYYMYRDADGVAFKYDQMYRCCSPEKLTGGDYGVCWGMAHEWGHVHQLSPYFKWGGLTEASNNVNTLDVIMRMGFGITSSKQAEFDRADDKLLRNSLAGTVGEMRHAAYVNASGSVNADLCRQMADSVITSADVDPDHALSYLEITSDQLVVWYKLFGYIDEVLGQHDFAPDLYERLRNTESGTDTYSRLATQQNSAARANVVPFELNFVRQASMLCGYNLYPFFEKYGFFRTIALYYKDYSMYYYLMDKTTRDNFKAHMDGLVTDGTLKAMGNDMLQGMLNYKTQRSYHPDWSAFKN